MKPFLFISTFLLSIFYGFSQTYTVKGKITRNNEPLPEVSVAVKEAHKGTYTDSLGNYSLKLSKGTYTIAFFYGSEKTKIINLTADTTLNADLTDLSSALDEVFISSLRVDADSPITHSNLKAEEIRKRNLGQDVPILLNHMPNVTTTSDAGAGIGHTGIRVRGSDETRVNVTINGVPLNDAESQGAFWVNLGDFTSSIQDLQLQRGVGTSTNGPGAFGGSLNVLTKEFEAKPSAEITNTYGSFNTHKHQAEFNTGVINDHFAFTGNFSTSETDGYRDRAFANLQSYFLQGTYHKENTLIKAIGFGGEQSTYQAYYGITPEQLEENRKFNPAGMYTDAEGNTQFYDNQTDNYKQDHGQILWNQKYSQNWSSNLSFHYTYGRGYYESYHEDALLEDFGLNHFECQNKLQTSSDLINQKWLSNHLYGTVFSVQYKKRELKAELGGGWNYYSGDHYGEVIYTQFAQNEAPSEHYYDNTGTKTDFNVYLKSTWALTDKLKAFGDLQLRRIDYKIEGLDEQEVLSIDNDFVFFNPKAGLTYQFNPEHQLYFSFARANKEPVRTDYKNAVYGTEADPVYPKAENLNDFELGWRYDTKKFQLNSNLYYMDYHNQLILTGEIDPQGRFIRENSGRSHRLGIEIDADITIAPNLKTQPSLAISQNKNKDYTATEQDELIDYGNTTISFSPNAVVGNILTYKPLNHLELSLSTKFVDRQYMSNTEERSAKLDGYFVNDLNIQYSWKNVPLFKEVIFKGMLNNFLDEHYSTNGNYSAEGGPLYYPQAGINFLSGVTLRF